MFCLRILSDVRLEGGPLDGQHLRGDESHILLAPGTDTIAVHHGWRDGLRGSGGVGRGAIPLYLSRYDPSAEPLDVSIYRAHPEEVEHSKRTGGTWYVERMVFVATLPEDERQIAESRRNEYTRQFISTVGSALSLKHTMGVASLIARVTLDQLNDSPAFATRYIREMRDRLTAGLRSIYSGCRVPSFHNEGFSDAAKQGDEIRA